MKGHICKLLMSGIHKNLEKIRIRENFLELLVFSFFILGGVFFMRKLEKNKSDADSNAKDKKMSLIYRPAKKVSLHLLHDVISEKSTNEDSPNINEDFESGTEKVKIIHFSQIEK